MQGSRRSFTGWSRRRPRRGPVAPVRVASGALVPTDRIPRQRTWMAWPDDRRSRELRERLSTATSRCGPGVTIIGSTPVDDCWMRDDSPVLQINGAGGLDAIGLNFNAWGNKQTHANDALMA